MNKTIGATAAAGPFSIVLEFIWNDCLVWPALGMPEAIAMAGVLSLGAAWINEFVRNWKGTP